MSSSQNTLPPLRESVPEIQQPPGQQYAQALSTHPRGPPTSTFPPSQHALTPSTQTLRGSNHPSHSSAHASHPSTSTVSSSASYYSENRRGSHTSPASSIATRDSPVLPPVSGSLGEYRERLPPIHTNGDDHYARPEYAQYNMRGSPPPPRQLPYHPHYSAPSTDYYAGRPTYSGSNGNTGYSMNYGSHTNGAYPMSFDQTEINDGKQKRRRGNLPKHVTDILRRWFHDHIGHPYPTEEEKHNLMTETGLSMSQISNWFINARRRNLPGLQKSAHAEQELCDSQRSLQQHA